MPTIRLIYFSENQIDPNAGSAVRVLSNILSASNRNNKPREITGALMFDDQWFLQVLEGERSRVWETFDRIKEDERHSNIVVAEAVEIDRRVFGNWWMGIATRTAQTEHAFKPFLRHARLDPHVMKASEMLALARELARVGLARELAEPTTART